MAKYADNGDFMEPNYSDTQPYTNDAPPAGYTDAVWPPPPTTEQLLFSFPFKTVFLRTEGSVPDFRVGGIQFGTSGITISGKCVPRSEIQIPVLIASVPFRIFLIVYIIMEYAVRHDETLQVAWQNVRNIVVNPKKRHVCICYDAPNYKGIVKTFSLTTKLDQPTFETFLAVNSQQAMPPAMEGKLKSWTSPGVLIFCCALLLTILVIAVAVAIGHFGK
jgi:hypothetical protein